MHTRKFPCWHLWTVNKILWNPVKQTYLVPCWKCRYFLCYCTSFSALKTWDKIPPVFGSGKLTQPNSNNHCRAEPPRPKMCRVLSKGRGRGELTRMSVLSCMSLVPKLNYQHSHISDFSLKMFYEEPGESERHCADKRLGRNRYLLSHTSPLVWLTE